MMATDEEKCKIAKLLQGLEVPDIKLSERSIGLAKEFQRKFGSDIEAEPMDCPELTENPYIPDKQLLEENEMKLRELLSDNKRAKRATAGSIVLTGTDPNRPWRTNSGKERLLRIDGELKRHSERASQSIDPMNECDMKILVEECRQDTCAAPAVGAARLRDTVEEARKHLPNFQYRMIENKTATNILPEAHKDSINKPKDDCSGQYIPRPDTKQSFLRSLAELRNLRVLALEYSHIADGSGGALLSLLPVIKRPHFRLQLICREDQTPGRADAALGCGGYEIPDTAWKRICIYCPDLYLLMVFFRIADYDHIRRFLSPSIPLRETHLQVGIDLDLGQRQHSDLSCFVRHLAHYFANTLVTVSIHQWRRSVFPLRRVFELMPRLVRFFYVGVVEDEVDLRRMLRIIACGVCDKLKQVNVQIQDSQARRTYWQDVVTSLLDEFKDIMDLLDINFCLGVYKC